MTVEVWWVALPALTDGDCQDWQLNRCRPVTLTVTFTATQPYQSINRDNWSHYHYYTTMLNLSLYVVLWYFTNEKCI